MNKALLLASTIAAGLIATPALATLQLSIGANGSTFTCQDGELSCDLSGGANNLLTIDTTVGGAFVQITLAQATFGASNTLQLSSSNIENLSGAPLVVTLLASATGFTAPVTSVNNSASLTFNSNIGATDSTLKFWADAADTQGANPTNTPGTLLENVSGHAITDPDSFSGSNDAAFIAGLPFSMTEGAALSFITGGSITGFNEAMITSAAVPEPATWGLLGLGFVGLGLVHSRRKRPSQFA